VAGAAVETRSACTSLELQSVASALRFDVGPNAHQRSAVGVDNERSVTDNQNVTASGRQRAPTAARRTLINRNHRYFQIQLQLHLQIKEDLRKVRCEGAHPLHDL